ncbi:hypothetical protein [Alicyclobacillus fastidiosus]|nr:hypothetical protein [Alicyclobacillus fastidiosus]WEH11932.1 hypothetical protein PYS47_12320 [Alicyclobacillus fastidiosus]
MGGLGMTARTRSEERTGFQELSPYHPTYDLQADFVMVYGIDETMPDRIKQWRDKGYIVHLMTGVSWGEYQDYLNGKVDGRGHWDEAQRNSKGDNISHGIDVPYMVPTIAFADFLTERIRVAVDAGVDSIHLEEPEFWVEGGYSDAFKREWEIYYREPWQPPHETEDAQYRASRLKAYLFTRCLDQMCSTLKEYAKVTYDRNIRFYVPTHSLINYTQWRIVSPESRLLDLPGIDGYIAQIWTGTARTPNVYEGIRKERTFETAFLEYGIMQELVRGTNRRMWFLHDPIEDDPKHTWKDYEQNYFKTVVASLFHPHISRFEICPWPSRVFNGKYPREDELGRENIPADYATKLLVVMHALGDMDQKRIAWREHHLEVGILLADSAMYQRRIPELNPVHGSTANDLLDWSPFYGLALPLLKHGLVVRPVQLDNIKRFPAYLDDYRILVLSYEFMKPESPDLHNSLAQWVLDGGILIYVGDGSDGFHQVREWWNQGKRKYLSPAEHLFESLGLGTSLTEGSYSVGKGILAYCPIHPASCAHERVKANRLRDMVKDAIGSVDGVHLEWCPTNAFVLERGPYVIASVMDESYHQEPVVLSGSYVNLFDANLPIVHRITLNPGDNILLYDLTAIEQELQLIAASSRIEAISRTDKGFEFVARGPENVNGIARFRCPQRPQKIMIQDNVHNDVAKFEWDEPSSTLCIRYANNPTGVHLKIYW